MDKVYNVVKTMFSGLDNTFLIKYYSISIFILVLGFIGGSPNIQTTLLAILSAILFPFSVLVLNTIMDIFFGNTAFIMPIVVMIFVKLFKVILLYAFSIVIAPIGIIYVYFKTCR